MMRKIRNMITFPNVKINLGLNITEKRSDGYHNLETIFYPVHLEDALEIGVLDSSEKEFELHIHGKSIDSEPRDNLVVKAYKLLKKEYALPPLDIYLFKQIPSGAGLGGGSSDAAFMIKMLNEKFQLMLSDEELERYAASLGADCAFFIKNKPIFATGIGDIFHPVDISLKGFKIVIIKPDISVSTRDAFSLINPCFPEISLTQIAKMPIEKWKIYMKNDFEESVFVQYPEIARVKKELYDNDAIYASMSGSGSSVYGIFDKDKDLSDIGNKYSFSWHGLL